MTLRADLEIVLLLAGTLGWAALSTPVSKQEEVVLVQVFYPFVLAYLIASYLQGGVGAGSSGPLTNLRQYLWVPIFQTAYRYWLHAWQ